MQDEKAKPKPKLKRYDDEPLLLEAMQALAASPGRRWLRERGGFDPDHMDVRITTARAYSALVAAVENAVKPRPSSDWAR